MSIFETQIRVRYSETDQMGVVHHSRYYPWFEQARTEMFEALGYGYAKMEEEGFALPLSESYCKYKRPIKYPDKIIIATRMTSMSGAKIIFEYDVYNETKEVLLAQGKTVHAMTDIELKLINLKKTHPSLYELILLQCEPTD